MPKTPKRSFKKNIENTKVYYIEKNDDDTDTEDNSSVVIQLPTVVIDIEDDILQLHIREDFMIKDTLEQGRDFNIYGFKGRINRHINDYRKVTIDSEHPFSKKELFYYHIENDSNYLDEYSVLSVRDNPILTVNIEEMKGKTLRFHYRGYTEEMKIEE